MAPKETMRAVVFKGKLEVAIEERPVPKIEDPKDIIVKVRYTALCGRFVKIYSALTSPSI
jgi:threonine dehydrogenase-like Zn-dependent dehydrogenase